MNDVPYIGAAGARGQRCRRAGVGAGAVGSVRITLRLCLLLC
jgi:hypothetical protein